MKTKSLLAAAAIVLSVAFSSCKKNSDNTPGTGKNTNHPASTMTFTIDGDGYTAKSVTINGSAAVLENIVTYFPKWDYTGLNIGDQATEGAGNKTSADIYFDGKPIGSEAFGKPFKNEKGLQVEVNMSIILQKSGSSVIYTSDKNGAGQAANGTLKITKFSDVNGMVEGDFQGTFFNISDGQSVQITKGHFSVPRGMDTSF